MTSIASTSRPVTVISGRVPEILEAKLDLMVQLDQLARPDCVLATNSSSFRSSEMLESVELKNRVLNTHYMPPSNACVELMSSTYTDQAIFDLLMRECASRESLHVLSEGVAEPADIDMLFKDWFGARDGPCDMMDKVGLDTVRNIEMNYIKQGEGLTTKPLDWLKENYIDKGTLRAKTGGKGLYRP
ncbi:hypothetical protein BU16DRAFT_620137 [Lophium mytilinum]|uniref:NAD(P)-binding protein n=1 Tax=Lophium mytilinum TaxID=390894 RepID=A0A6A6QL95_9PEZI|nr:hypothetical protein BU16DRAFT_620137 [Lophium mytilinum]